MDSVKGGVENGIPILPLVPSYGPQTLDKGCDPPFFAEELVTLGLLLVEELGRSPMERDEASETIFPTEFLLFCPGLSEKRVSAVADWKRGVVP